MMPADPLSDETTIPGEATAPMARALRPQWLPEKFWDAETGQPRLESLAKSYRELEQRFTGAEGDDGSPGDGQGAINLLADVPETADGYEVTIGDKVEQVAPEIASRLLAAGFSRRQAQLAYDLAAEHLSPLADEIESRTQADHEQGRLAEHFGGPRRWAAVSRQLEAWGRANLSAGVFDAMTGSFEGVVALHRMMDAGEPALLAGGDRAAGELNLDTLKQRMRDPKYWRERDPRAVAEVRQGFQALFPGS